MNKDGPIGVFDSGVGGLTVVKEIIRELPQESLIYLGDTARVPYGTRSSAIITKFALELVGFLLKKKVKCLVVACNTISANSLDAIKKISPVPVIDVIGPTIAAASGKIGVIATASTINSQAYSKIASVSKACPLFVPLAEEGMTEGIAVGEIARGYLLGFKKAKIDTLILGCTHYPLLHQVIAKTMGNKVKLVESGPPTVRRLHEVLAKKDLLVANPKPRYEFFFTDRLERVIKIATNFFGRPLPGKIKRIEL